MAWSDEPTKAQLDRIYYWLNWETRIATEKAKEAANWLGENATRKEVSDEMQRLKRLKDKKTLSLDNCFDSPIWEGFEG